MSCSRMHTNYDISISLDAPQNMPYNITNTVISVIIIIIIYYSYYYYHIYYLFFHPIVPIQYYLFLYPIVPYNIININSILIKVYSNYKCLSILIY